MEVMAAESTIQQISTLRARSNAALEPNCFFKNIPRGNFEDRRDAGGGVVSATPPLCLSAENKTPCGCAQSKKLLKLESSRSIAS